MDYIYILRDAVELGLIWSLLALGVFVSFRILDFADLTVEGSMALGGALTASLMLKGHPIFSNYFVVIILVIIFGAIAGITTGVLHTKLKIPGILAGIISMTALYSINLMIMKGASLYIPEAITIYNPLDWFFSNVIVIENLATQRFISKTLTSFLVVGLFTTLIYWFFGTEVGMSVRTIGSNKQMARAQGINTDKMIIVGLAISNALIALTGSLYAQSFKTSNMDIGRGTIVIGLAAIILGETIVGKKTFKRWLIAVITGSIVFQLLIGIAINLGFSANNLKLLQAILIAIVLANPTIKTWIKERRNKEKGESYA